MILTDKAMQAINNSNSRMRLALSLGFTERWIQKLIKANKNNGPLTTVGALKALEQETGLNAEELLVDMVEHSKAA